LQGAIMRFLGKGGKKIAGEGRDGSFEENRVRTEDWEGLDLKSEKNEMRGKVKNGEYLLGLSRVRR